MTEKPKAKSADAKTGQHEADEVEPAGRSARMSGM